MQPKQGLDLQPLRNPCITLLSQKPLAEPLQNPCRTLAKGDLQGNVHKLGLK